LHTTTPLIIAGAQHHSGALPVTHPSRRRSAFTFTAALAAIAVPSQAQAEDNFEADEKGLTARTGDLEVNLGGRLQLDASVFDQEIDNGTAADVRRARIEFSARLGDVVRVRAEREFAQADGWRNLWIGISPVKNLKFRGGNQVVPFSMEEMQSSNTWRGAFPARILTRLRWHRTPCAMPTPFGAASCTAA
jgi:hypothetical protein